MGFYLRQQKKNSIKLKLPRRGKQDSWQAWHDRTGQDTCDGELAQDCKHKETIKGANKEGNEERQVGQINQ